MPAISSRQHREFTETYTTADIVHPAHNKNNCQKHTDEGKASRMSDMQNGFLRRKRQSYKKELLSDGFSKFVNNAFEKCTYFKGLNHFGVATCVFVKTLLENLAIISCVKILIVHALPNNIFVLILFLLYKTRETDT